MRRIAISPLRWFALLVGCATIASTAEADAIASYTATDLGPESYGKPDYTISNSGANGTLTSPDGKTVYAFPSTNNLVTNPRPLLATLTSPGTAPIHDSETYGNPNYAYSDLTPFEPVYLNQAGQLLVTNVTGVDGHSSSAGSEVYLTTRQADGSFGPFRPLWSTAYNESNGATVAQVIGLNNSGLAIGVDSGNSSYYGSRDVFLYNLNTSVRTELASLLPTGWYWPLPIAIDDQGRILLEAEPMSPGISHDELFLLTPAGLSSDPIATPEPSTLATLAAAGVGLAVRRRMKARW